MIYVTHDQVEAMTMGDRITVMKDGVIHQVDAPEALYRYPADMFVGGFIGSPGMNFIEVSVSPTTPLLLDEGSLRIPVHPSMAVRTRDGATLAIEDILEPYRGKRIVLGLRPEHLSTMPTDGEHPVKLTLKHDMSEMLGSEMFLYLRSEKHSVTARSSTLHQFDIDATVAVFADMGQAHFFDPANGLRIA